MNIKILISLILCLLVFTATNANENNLYTIGEVLDRISFLENKIKSLETQLYEKPSVNHLEIISALEEKIKKYGLDVSRITVGNQWVIQPEQPGEQYLVFRHRTFNEVFGDKRLAYNGLNYKDL